LRYTRDFPLAVVEAKATYKAAADAVQQARSYAETLGLKFAYATNGTDIVSVPDALRAEIDIVKVLQGETAIELYRMLPAILDKAFRGES